MVRNTHIMARGNAHCARGHVPARHVVPRQSSIFNP